MESLIYPLIGGLRGWDGWSWNWLNNLWNKDTIIFYLLVLESDGFFSQVKWTFFAFENYKEWIIMFSNPY